MKNYIRTIKWLLCGIAALCWIITTIFYFQPKPVSNLLLASTGLATIFFGLFDEISNVYDYIREKTFYQNWDSLMVTFFSLIIGAFTVISSHHYGDYELLISLSIPLFAVLFPFFCARIYLYKRGYKKNLFFSIILLIICMFLLIPTLLYFLNLLSVMD